ncbi:MAG: BON domain-containing protein [Capsulimonadaceae bacterium]
MVTRWTIVGLLAAASLLWAGCSAKSEQTTSQNVSRGVSAVGQEANRIVVQAKPALTELGLGARVTTALRANANLPDTIRVDAGVGGVRLRGQVFSMHQKALAGRVAKQTVPAGITVSNQLVVTP